MSDQHNANCTGYAGNPNVETPALDALAQDGTSFQLVVRNNPICAPSRLSFITGQYCNQHGLLGNRNAPDRNRIPILGLPIPPLRLPDRTSRQEPHDPPLGQRRLRIHPLHGFGRRHRQRSADLSLLRLPGGERTRRPVRGRRSQAWTNYPDGSQPASLSYEHSIEHFTGSEPEILRERDHSRPLLS